jgi:type II secretory pathway pseudopilin PulG
MKKSVVMIVIMAVMVVLTILAITALTLMTQESRRAEDKIRHMRAFYAAQAGSVFVLEQRSKGVAVADGALPIAIGNNMPGYPSGGYNPVIKTTANAGGPGIDEINITVGY